MLPSSTPGKLALQLPWLQNGVICGQMLPQPPQFLGSVLGLTSQPSTPSMLQSMKPGLHCSEQTPLEQVAMAFWLEHGLPHAPQAARLTLRSASQPFAGLLSQSPKPMLQTFAHCPLTQEAAIALGRSGQMLPQ